MSSIDFDLMQFESASMNSLLATVDKVAPSQASVLISGALGTGKSTLAQYIHRRSQKNSVVVIDLKNSDSNTFSEDAETIILENIEYASTDLQRHLFERINNLNQRNQRFIATTRKELKTLVRQEKFRSDLLYKLSVIHLEIPSLIERKEDILNLSQFFLQVYGIVHGKSQLKMTQNAQDKLMNWDWPANVRELENVIERAALLAGDSLITDDGLQFEVGQEDQTLQFSVGMTLSEVEKRLILQTLELTAFNRTRAAHLLGISIRTLRNKLNEYRMEGAL